MIDDFGLYRREEPFDPFSVMLFKALQVVAFLFFMALLAIAPQANDGKVDSKAELIITMDWPYNHPDDLDLFVQDAAGNIVWYRHREAGFMVLERDDRGGANDFILVNGKKIASPILRGNRNCPRDRTRRVHGQRLALSGDHWTASAGNGQGAEAESDHPSYLRQRSDSRPHRR